MKWRTQTHTLDSCINGITRGFFRLFVIVCKWLCVCVKTAAMRLHQNDVIKINGNVCEFVCIVLSSPPPPPSPPMILIKIVISTIKHFMLIASALMDTVVHAVIRFMLPPNAWFFEKDPQTNKIKYKIKWKKWGKKRRNKHFSAETTPKIKTTCVNLYVKYVPFNYHVCIQKPSAASFQNLL